MMMVFKEPLKKTESIRVATNFKVTDFNQKKYAISGGVGDLVSVIPVKASAQQICANTDSGQNVYISCPEETLMISY